jgi:hypothetical protein
VSSRDRKKWPTDEYSLIARRPHSQVGPDLKKNEKCKDSWLALIGWFPVVQKTNCRLAADRRIARDGRICSGLIALHYFAALDAKVILDDVRPESSDVFRREGTQRMRGDVINLSLALSQLLESQLHRLPWCSFGTDFGICSANAADEIDRPGMGQYDFHRQFLMRG